MTNKLLILIDYFYPSSDSIGPGKSLSNLLQFYKIDEYIIYTRDSDKSGNKFTKSDKNNINKLFNNKIVYLDKFNYILFIFFLLPKYSNFYLNSFFSPKFSIIPLLLIRIFKFFNNKINIILSPKGELFDNALIFKKFKKNLYIFFFKLFDNNFITFHCSNRSEVFTLEKNIGILPYFIDTDKVIYDPIIPSDLFKRKIENNLIQICYFSRIDNKKNLHFCIDLLSNIKNKSDIQFNIFGSVSNKKYFDTCIKKLDESNLNYHYYGEYSHNELKQILSNQNIFIFPTFSENFGHVIYEALNYGVFCLISKNTPWIGKSKFLITDDLILENWNIHIEQLLQIIKDKTCYRKYFDECLEFANNYYKNQKIYSNNEKYFIYK